MIPICLVTGFLGSGKTTLLKNLAERYRDRNLVYLVNDFARLDVDGALMQEAGEAVVSISGGSIFCKCLVTDFMHQLERIHQGVATLGSQPDGVIIEASGMADPRVFQRMLEETRLDRHYELASILTVVDPGRFLKLIHTLPNIRTQVEAADVVLVNKQDLYATALLDEAEAAIRRIAPGATPVRTSNGYYDGDVFQAQSARLAGGDYAKCADPRYASFTMLDVGYDVEALLQCLHSIRDNLFRVKGHVELGGRTYFIEYAGGECTATPCTEPFFGERGLAFVVPGQVAARTQDQMKQFASAAEVAVVG